MDSFIKKEKLLVLGGCGYIGKQLQSYINKYYSSQYELVIVDRINVQTIYKCHNIDILQSEKLSEVLIKELPDYIINLAGTNRVENLELGFQSNVLLSQKIFEIIRECKELKIKKILLIGSAAEYGRNDTIPLSENDALIPINLYGLSKVFQTQCALFNYRTFGVPVVIARTFNIIGEYSPTTTAIGSFVDKLAKISDNGIVSVGNIDTLRDYLYIDDVIEAYLKILAKGVTGEIYNVCSSQAVSMRAILEEMIRISGKRAEIISSSELKSEEIKISCGDNAKLKKLGWDLKTDLKIAIKNIMGDRN